jgi:hypothetical protein
MAVTRDDIQDPTGCRTLLPGVGFMRGFGPSDIAGSQTVGTPPAGAAGFAPGAIWQNAAGANGTFLYVNIGTSTSATWLNIDGLLQLPAISYSTGTTLTTFTAAEATGGALTVYNSTATTPGSIATPTAAAMFAAQPGAYVGQQWVWRIINSSSAANTMTITADASVTLSGTTTYTIAEFAYRDFAMKFTSATAANMVAICGGAAATN